MERIWNGKNFKKNEIPIDFFKRLFSKILILSLSIFINI